MSPLKVPSLYFQISQMNNYLTVPAPPPDSPTIARARLSSGEVDVYSAVSQMYDFRILLCHWNLFLCSEWVQLQVFPLDNHSGFSCCAAPPIDSADLIICITLCVQRNQAVFITNIYQVIITVKLWKMDINHHCHHKRNQTTWQKESESFIHYLIWWITMVYSSKNNCSTLA